eukprot:gene28665-34607_t
MHLAFNLDDCYCQECGKMMDCDHIGLADRAKELQLLKSQLVSTGYFVVRHKLPDSTLMEAFRSCQAFFSQRREDKERAYSLDRARRGYSSVQTDNFASLSGFKKPNDIVEKFRIGPIEGTTSDEYYTSKEGRVHFFPNTWPNLSGGFQVSIEMYYEEMRKLSCSLLVLLEHLFDLPKGSLVSTMHRHTSILGLNAYLPLSTYPASVYEEHFRRLGSRGSQQEDKAHDKIDGVDIEQSNVIERVAEHVDVSVFTIVAEASIVMDTDAAKADCTSMMSSGDNTNISVEAGGIVLRDDSSTADDISAKHRVVLQMFNYQLDAWEDVHLEPDCFLVNVGECLSDWTRSCRPPSLQAFSSALSSPSSTLPKVAAKPLYLIPPARHRVIEKIESLSSSTSPLPDISSISCVRSRFSLAFFCSPAYTAPLVWPDNSNDATFSHGGLEGKTIAQTSDCDTVVGRGDTIDVMVYGKWRQKKIKETVRIIKSTKML